MSRKFAVLLTVLLVGCSAPFQAELFPPETAGAAGSVGLTQAGAGGSGSAAETGGTGGKTHVGGAGAPATGGGAGGLPSATGGASTGGTGSVGQGGEPATGGADTGGTGGSATGGAASGGTSSTGGTACDLPGAVARALPGEFVWGSYNSSAVIGSEMACTKCKASPCGSVPITWGQPVQSDPSTFLVSVATASQCVAGLYGTCGTIVNNCTLCLSVQSAVVTLKLAQTADGYNVSSAEVSGAWSITGPYTNSANATTAANSSLTSALTGLHVSCP